MFQFEGESLDQFSAESLERLDAYVRFQQSHFEILTNWWAYALPLIFLASFALSVWLWSLCARLKLDARLNLQVSPMVFVHLFLCVSFTGWFQGCGNSVSKPAFETGPLSGGEFGRDPVVHSSLYVGQSQEFHGSKIAMVKYWPVTFASYADGKCRTSNLAVPPVSQELSVVSKAEKMMVTFHKTGCFLIEDQAGKRTLVNVQGAAQLAAQVIKAHHEGNESIPAAFNRLGATVASLSSVSNSPGVYTLTLFDTDQKVFLYTKTENLDSSLLQAVSALESPKPPASPTQPSDNAVAAFNSYLAMTAGGSSWGFNSDDREDDALWRRYLGATKYMIWNGFSNSERKLMWLRFWSLSGVGTPWSLPLARVQQEVRPLGFFENALIRDPITPYLAHLGSWRMPNEAETGEPGSHPLWGRAYVFNASSFTNPKYHTSASEGSELAAYDFLYDDMSAEPGDVYEQVLRFLQKGIHFGLEIGMSIVLGERINEKYAHQQAGNWNDLEYRSLLYFSNPDVAMEFRERFLREWKTTILGFEPDQEVSADEYYQRAKAVILTEFESSSSGEQNWTDCYYSRLDNIWCNTQIFQLSNQQTDGQSPHDSFVGRNFSKNDLPSNENNSFRQRLEDGMDYAFMRHPDRLIQITPTPEGGAKLRFLTEEYRWQTGGDVDPFSLYWWLMLRKTSNAFSPATSLSLRFLRDEWVQFDVDSANFSDVRRMQAFVYFLHGQIFSDNEDGSIGPGLYSVSSDNNLDLPIDGQTLGKIRKEPLVPEEDLNAVAVGPGQWLSAITYDGPSEPPAFQMKKAHAVVGAAPGSTPPDLNLDNDPRTPLVRARLNTSNCLNSLCASGCGFGSCTIPPNPCDPQYTWTEPLPGIELELLDRFNEFQNKTFRGQSFFAGDLEAPSSHEIWTLRKSELQAKISQGSLDPSWGTILNLFSLLEGVNGFNQKAFALRSHDRIRIVNSNRLVDQAPGFRPSFIGGIIGSDLSNPTLVGDTLRIASALKGILNIRSDVFGVKPAWDSYSWLFEKDRGNPSEVGHVEARSVGSFHSAFLHGRNYEKTVAQSFSFGHGMPQRDYATTMRGSANQALSKLPLVNPHLWVTIDGLPPITLHFDAYGLNEDDLYPARYYPNWNGAERLEPDHLGDEFRTLEGPIVPPVLPPGQSLQSFARDYRLCVGKKSGSNVTDLSCAAPTDAFFFNAIALPSSSTLRVSNIKQPPRFAGNLLLKSRDLFKREVFLAERKNNEWYIPGSCSGDYQPPALMCGSPAAGSCFEESADPYCDNQDCCSAICSFAPECCENSWDAFCVYLAQNFCL